MARKLADGAVVWNVSSVLNSLSFKMLEHHRNGQAVSPETVRNWHQSLHRAHRAYNALMHACQELVEEGSSPSRLDAMKVALTHAMGETDYGPGTDRW